MLDYFDQILTLVVKESSKKDGKITIPAASRKTAKALHAGLEHYLA